MATEVIKALVERNRESVLKRLPTYLRPEHFFQLVYTLDKDHKLAAVAQRNPDSVLSAIFKAADCGLTIGGAFQHCYVIPYKDVANFQVGWRGFVYQWLHAGAVLKVVSNVVYTGDEIEILFGDTEGITHKPALNDPHRQDMKWMNDKRNILGSYAVAWLPTGLKMYRWVPVGMIERARASSQNTGPDSPWTQFYPAMAAKTAVRRLDGLIQMCGPTPENREAWDRYARTIELDRASFRIDDIDEQPDDLPGVRAGKSNPTSGATAEHGSMDNGTTLFVDDSPPQSKGEGRSAGASTPSSPKESDDPLGDEKQEELIELANMSSMKFSTLKKYVSDTYGVNDLSQLRPSQARELELELKQRAAKQ